MMPSSPLSPIHPPPVIPYLHADSASDPDASIELHHLCAHCLRVCANSRILNNAAWHRTSTLPDESAPDGKLPGAATNPAAAFHMSREAQVMRAMQTLGMQMPTQSKSTGSGERLPMFLSAAQNWGPAAQEDSKVVHDGKPGWVEGYFPESFVFHESLEGLRKAAVEEGCHLCSLFCAKIDGEGRDYLVDKQWSVPIWDILRAKLDGKPFRVAISWECDFSEEEVYYRLALMNDCTDLGKKQEFSRVKIVGLHDTKDNDEAESLTMQNVRSGLWTGSKARFDLAAQWIKTCREKHNTTCVAPQIPRLPPFTPTRLVDVGATSGSEKPRLVVTAEQPDAIEYLTLSHCWGPAPIAYKLTTDTMDEMVQAIDVSKLDQNFRDAFSVTRKLGYRYIWIDSLCIIQDSRGDWAKESAIMGKLFLHSQCTIAALCAESSKEGFFRVHNPRTLTSCRLPVKLKLSAAPFRKPPADKRPLYSRAWVFQERLLSPRVLRFGNDQISWECQAAMADEYDPVQRPQAELKVYRDSDGAKDKLIREAVAETFAAARELDDPGEVPGLAGPLKDSSHKLFFEAWQKLVRAYSDLNLTYPSDRFPAFAGITSVQQDRMALTCFEGLWLENFIPSLLWYCKPKTGLRLAEEINSIRPERKEFLEAIYTAKTTVNSLSWASIEGEVEYSDWPLWDFAKDNFTTTLGPGFAGNNAGETRRATKPRQLIAGEEAPNSPEYNYLLDLHERKHSFRILHYDPTNRAAPDDPLFGEEMSGKTRIAHQAKIRVDSNCRYRTSLLRLVPANTAYMYRNPSTFVLRGPVFRFVSGPLEHSLQTSWVLPPFVPKGLLDPTAKYRWFFPDLKMLYHLPLGARLEVTCLAVVQWDDVWAHKPEGHVAGVVLARLIDNGRVDKETLEGVGKGCGTFARIGFFDFRCKYGVVSQELLKFAKLETVIVV
ncbi:heterokaryon incompatibility protein-domain-containing protein [Xylariales sp. PMI_506]|nr:heterokaryon incompatibility protein-domain-containing protein [Xylariales sp. PMI_506]